MAKVLLVEDDNNLREIFEMRLQAEGYETLSASDGEEALVVATREKPELIIADVMMPKLSGFEMLETLRAAPEMANVKVIMMTALGQAEDRARGEKLGVIKYLVKSQVTLEDFVRVVREVLPPGETSGTPADTTDASKNQVSKSTNNKQESETSMQDDNTNPMSGDSAAPSTPAGDQMSSEQQQNVVNDQVKDFTASAPSSAPVEPPATPPAGDSGATGGETSSFPPAEPPTDEPKPEGPATPPAAA